MTDMNDIIRRIGLLLEGPADPGRPFDAPGASLADVYAMAAGFREQRASLGPRGPVCLCAENRAVIAAALLASMADGSECILPYSLSRQAIEATRGAMRFEAAIVDGPRDLPPGVRPLVPARALWTPSSCRDPDGVFLRLFTGGTTGQPTAWSKTPVNLMAEAFFLVRRYGIGREDLFAATVPPYHIYGLLFTVLVPLAASATVLGGTFVYPEEIAAALRGRGATVLVSVPVHYRAMRDAGVAGPRLRLAFSSAGPLDREDSLAFFRQSGTGVEEIYGSTETGGIAARCQATGRDILEPFDCVRWRIEDERLMVQSPFISPDLPLEEGYYVTGDRAAAAGSGFTLLGRADGIVKVGGKRVALQIVQDAIRRIPGVRDAVVISLPSKTGRAVEIAAVIDSEMDEDAVRRAMTGRMEPYEVPRRIRLASPIPAASTGKYDRDAIVRLFDTISE